MKAKNKRSNKQPGCIYKEHTLSYSNNKHRYYKYRYVAEIYICGQRFRFRSSSIRNTTNWLNNIRKKKNKIIFMINNGMTVPEIKETM